MTAAKWGRGLAASSFWSEFCVTVMVAFLFAFVGATRSHLDLFKKHRAARIDHYVIEVNKLIIRLEKVIITQLNHDFICTTMEIKFKKSLTVPAYLL